MGKTRYTLFRYQIWRIIIGEERPQKGGLKKTERTFVLLNTHRFETHQHNLCFLIDCQLESGNNHSCNSALIGLINHQITEETGVTCDLDG